MEMEKMIELIDAVSKSDLTGFKYEEDGIKLHLSKKENTCYVTENVSAPVNMTGTASAATVSAGVVSAEMGKTNAEGDQTLGAAAEEAVEDAAVLEEEEPPHAASAPAALRMPAAFRKERREIQFFITKFSLHIICLRLIVSSRCCCLYYRKIFSFCLSMQCTILKKLSCEQRPNQAKRTALFQKTAEFLVIVAIL